MAQCVPRLEKRHCRLTGRRNEHFLAAHALHFAAARNRDAHNVRYAMSLDLVVMHQAKIGFKFCANRKSVVVPHFPFKKIALKVSSNGKQSFVRKRECGSE